MRDDEREEVTPTPAETPENDGFVSTPEQEANAVNDTPVVEEATFNEAPVEETPTAAIVSESTPAEETPVTPVSSTETVTPFAAAAATPAPKKPKKGLLIALVSIGAALLLVGGSALAYNFWYQNPDKVVSDAIVNAITAKSVSATGSLEVKSDDYKLKIEASGKTSPEANSEVGIKLSYTADAVNVTVDGQGIYSAEGDIYVKLNDIKKLTASIEEQSDGQISFEVFGGVIEKVDNKWVKIGKEDLGDFSEDIEKAQKCFADISKQLEEDAAFRREVENETKELYKNNTFIVVGEKLGSRTINGQGSLGYELSADASVADQFFTGLADTQIGKKVAACDDSITFEDIVSDEAKKDDGTETKAEIWVSRFGHFITEVSLRANEDGTEAVMIMNPTFNKDETVTIPTDAIPFSEVKADIERAFEDYSMSYADDYETFSETEATTTEFN